MSIARHHAEWLSLVPVSGPFLSLPVLMEAFNTGLEPHDPDQSRLLRQEYANWQESFEKRKADPAPHQHWIKFVLTKNLELDDRVLAEGQAIPQTLQAEVPEHHELLRPSIVVIDPNTKKPRLLVQTYPRSQELTSYVVNSRWKASPDTRMTELLHATGVRLGLVTNGEHWMLVDAPKGETTGYASWYASLWLEEPITLRAFRSLLSASRFFNVPEDKTLEALLTKSASNQQEVTDQLGYQVRRAVEVLIHSLDRADQDFGRELFAGVREEVLYESALTVMMRLVFLFCAEERELIPSKPFPVYEQNYSVSTISKQLRELADQHGEELLERRYDAWPRLLAAFRAVHGGLRHDDVHIPAYGGNLFNPDRFPFLEGRKRGTSWRDAEANPLPVNNRTVLHLLEALQYLQTKVPGSSEKTLRRLSFRALDIEQIGHVYEGLLDHTAKRAAEPFLGLAGTREKEPEISLVELEKRLAKGEADLIQFLEDQTGRSESGINSDLFASLEAAFDIESLPQSLTKYKPLISKIVNGVELEDERKLEELEAALHDVLKRNDPVSVVCARHILEQLRKQRSQTKSTAKKRKPSSKSQGRIVDEQFFVRIRTACQGDDSLYQRVKVFAGLVRLDSFGYPVVIPKGSVFVTAGTDRRSSGTHYTPRSLTEPIVQYTLEPLVYVGPAEGKPKGEWKLKSAKELLELKICDMACGSGAFLVQAARYMAERLLEAWDEAKKANPQTPGITPEGTPSTGKANEAIIPDDPAERKTYAMRIIAQRCLYGVDKNPLAAEMAKLSLWLLTLAKDKPFEFLDHSIRCGDSLVGLHSIDQLRHYSLKPDADDAVLFKGPLDSAVDETINLRLKLEDMPANTVEDVQRQEKLLIEANEKIARLRCAADLLVAAEFWGESAKDKLERVRHAAVQSGYYVEKGPTEDFENAAAKERRGQMMFHWPLEFPEVIVKRDGFDAFVGNPPFLGGKRLTTELGESYTFGIKALISSQKGAADLCAYFFLRAGSILKSSGIIGLVATNSISQGATREIGLQALIDNGSCLFRAHRDAQWPGAAGVTISPCYIFKGKWLGHAVLNELTVEGISTYLEPEAIAMEPFALAGNEGIASIGTYLNGAGFILEDHEYAAMIASDTANSSVLQRYLTSKDINQSPESEPTRFVINFGDLPESKAARFKVPFIHLRTTVKPQRDKLTRQIHEHCFWKHWDRREAFYERVCQLDRVLVCGRVSKHHIFEFAQVTWLISDGVVMFLWRGFGEFAVLQSILHCEWVQRHKTTMRLDTNYSVSRCFMTFPMPNKPLDEAATFGERLHSFRRHALKRNECGLTDIYNRFHDADETAADIQQLRDLHVEMDRAVAAAYGWSELALGHGFHETKQGVRFTINESARREVLQRLLKLNHERYAEEMKQGLHGKKGTAKKAASKKKAASTSATQEASLFDGEDDE